MAEDSQSLPLAHYKSDEQQPQQKLPIYNSPINKHSNKCFIYVFSAFVFLCVAALIFSLIVLRVNSPTIHLSSISLPKFSISNTTTTTNSSSYSLHLTFISEFALDNSNYGPFNFDNGTVGFMYGGEIVGERSTGGGRAEAKGRKRMNVTVEANFEKNVSSSFGGGDLNLISFANFRGRVRLIHVFTKTISSHLTCSLNLDLNTHQILPDWVCE